MFHIILVVACPPGLPLASARHLATLLIVLVYISRPRHSQSSAQLSRVRGRGRGRAWCRHEPPSTTLLLNPSLSWCAAAEQERGAEAGLAMMAGDGEMGG